MSSANILTVVPFFNRRHTILDAMESIKAQTLIPRQLIVVDDGSTDGGPELVDGWISRNRGLINCRLHRQAKSAAGAAAGRNSGLRLGDHSDFVAFLDSDDMWPADFLQRTHALLTVEPRAVAATCDRKFVFGPGVPDEINDTSAIADNATLWLLEHGAGLASATLFRRSAVDKLGRFPLIAAGEDAALFLPLSLEGLWLHAPGKPISFSRGLAERLGDQKNLSDEFSDGRFSWANIYEDFLVRGAGRAFLHDRRYRRLVARMWYTAGRELTKNGAPQEAVACFRKALGWNPWRAKCHVRMLGALLKARSNQSRPFAKGDGPSRAKRQGEFRTSGDFEHTFR
jgi:glycosyltransferase involved in cell wall biosynthesis